MSNAKQQTTTLNCDVQLSHCQLSFGIADLTNPFLVKSFFPEDLPKDWYPGYYANEFEQLLVHLSDADYGHLSDYREEINEDFTIILDVSGLSEKHKQQVVNDDAFYCVDLQHPLESSLSEGPVSIDWLAFINHSSCDSILAYVRSEVKIEALELRKLIEQIQHYGRDHQCKKISIIFSPAEFALINCQTAMILASMM